MDRPGFIALLASESQAARARVHVSGPLVGLPYRVENALQIARRWRESRSDVPSDEEIRSWYLRPGEGPVVITPGLLRAHEALGQLTENDLVETELGMLVAFVIRCESWSHAARERINELRIQG